MSRVQIRGAGGPGAAPGQPRPMFHRVLAADLAAVRETLEAIRARFQDEVGADAIGRLELVLAELMNNVFEHGRGEAPAPLIHLCIVSHECGLACALTDDGERLPDECLLPRSLPNTQGIDLPEGGFGWFLIQNLTQELSYNREEMRNFVAFCVPARKAG